MLRDVATQVRETRRAIERDGELVVFADDLAGTNPVHAYAVSRGEHVRQRDQATEVDAATVRLRVIPRVEGGALPTRNQLVVFAGSRLRVVNVTNVTKGGTLSHVLVDAQR